MAKTLKWAVIGSGGIARRRTIPEGIVKAENAKLVSVYDVNTEANTGVAKQFEAKPAENMQQVLDSDVDAVYIATPANFHFDQAIACAKTGKNVLCEKPLGLSVDQAQKMIDTFTQNNVLLGTGFMMRFHCQHRAALDMIQQGKLGTLIYGRAQLSCWFPPMDGIWRQDPALGGGGPLVDMGGHCIDLLEMLFGPVVKVSCFTNNTIHKYDVEDSAVAMLSFEKGALGTVDTFFSIPDAACKNVLEIYGSKGSILASGTIGQNDAGRMNAFLEEEQKGYEAQQQRTGEAGQKIQPQPVNTYKAEIEEFSDAIIEKRTPLNSAQLGLRSQKILAACYESAKTGKRLNID